MDSHLHRDSSTADQPGAVAFLYFMANMTSSAGRFRAANRRFKQVSNIAEHDDFKAPFVGVLPTAFGGFQEVGEAGCGECSNRAFTT